jgi:hypothetical protein
LRRPASAQRVLPACAVQDADSLDAADGKKKEGWFYVWDHSEVQQVLGEQAGKSQ